MHYQGSSLTMPKDRRRQDQELKPGGLLCLPTLCAWVAQGATPVQWQVTLRFGLRKAPSHDLSRHCKAPDIC